MGAQIKPPPGTGPYCFRIHGQIYHIVSPLYVGSEEKAGKASCTFLIPAKPQIKEWKIQIRDAHKFSSSSWIQYFKK
ncbi:hypothetical protein JTE90_008891 [Oedothorax gibbosus]|uniref:Uncharacterized protein n=1 Tax=Oedothorax gibbosus TaxID=931172 RepID=A0AAV6TV82_9ARAC|nr:hypothetical protein JTE90_008891 [Oedothorax gibbosus]